eukprot:4587624-Amphidinium_carterae.1
MFVSALVFCTAWKGTLRCSLRVDDVSPGSSRAKRELAARLRAMTQFRPWLWAQWRRTSKFKYFKVTCKTSSLCFRSLDTLCATWSQSHSTQLRRCCTAPLPTSFTRGGLAKTRA